MKRIRHPAKLPPRPTDAHKGDFGRVLVVGGSQGMIGAPALTGLAALRGGAGQVMLAVPNTIQQAVAVLCPCATSIPLPVEEGRWTPSTVQRVVAAAEWADILAVGPGLATGAGQEQLLRAILEQRKPVVLDADGLNNLAAIGDWPAQRRCPMILTPHPGEFARLTDTQTRAVQTRRQEALSDALAKWRLPDRPPLVLVLKGAGTLVSDGERLFENTTGNPGLATGGSGDVLTGLIAALTQQGLDLFDAACLGAQLHGLAGDLAAEELGEASLLATDLLKTLPEAMRE